MAFGFNWWLFGKKGSPQTTNASSTPGSPSPNGQPKRPGFREWISDTFKGSAKEASAIAQRTGRAMADNAVMQVKLKVLGLRIQHDLEALAVICREEITTLRRKRFADRNALWVSYVNSFTLTDQLGRFIISYANELQRSNLAQFDLPKASSNSNHTSQSTSGTASTPALPAANALTTAPDATELAVLCPPLTLHDHKIMGKRYLKGRAAALAELYQQILRTMEGIQRDLRKARSINELEMVNLVRRLNALVVYLLREEVAFGLETTTDDSDVSASLEVLVGNLNLRTAISAGSP